MPAGTSKPPRWSARALAAFENTLNHISADDPLTAEVVLARVERSVALIQSHPRIGTPTATPGYAVTRFRIAGTSLPIVSSKVRCEFRAGSGRGRTCAVDRGAAPPRRLRRHPSSMRRGESERELDCPISWV